METYSFWADLLQTFRMMSDGVKISLIYMPCVSALGFTALYLYHRRRYIAPARDRPQIYTLLPSETTDRQDRLHPSIETLRRLDDHIAEMKVACDVGRQ